MSELFLLDANIFIQANRVNYPMEVFPGFWEWLDQQNHSGTVKSVHPVYDEISAGNDNLAEWVKKRNSEDWFLRVDDEKTQKAYIEIANWVMSQDSKFKKAVRDEFLQVADPWLIAKAVACNAIVATHENYDPRNRKKV